MINSPQVNAFVVPGGKVVVYAGLMQLLKGPAQETQLAAVIGHEIAHVVARHAVRPQYLTALLQYMLCKDFAKPCSENTAVVEHTAAHVVANNSVIRWQWLHKLVQYCILHVSRLMQGLHNSTGSTMYSIHV